MTGYVGSPFPSAAHIPPPEEEWLPGARCRQGADPDWWFAPAGTLERLYARTQCLLCPVRRQCLEYACSTKQEHGMWAGFTDRQRKRVNYSLASLLEGGLPERPDHTKLHEWRKDREWEHRPLPEGMEPFTRSNSETGATLRLVARSEPSGPGTQSTETAERTAER